MQAYFSMLSSFHHFRHLVADIECDGFQKDASMIHCLCVKALNAPAQDVPIEYAFADHEGYLPLGMGLDLLQQAETIVGHNFMAFDAQVIKRLMGVDITGKVLDTLTLAKKLINLDDLAAQDRLSGLEPRLVRRLSLEAWGHRLGRFKGAFGKTADWKKFHPDMVEYCADDVRLTEDVYRYLETLV